MKTIIRIMSPSAFSNTFMYFRIFLHLSQYRCILHPHLSTLPEKNSTSQRFDVLNAHSDQNNLSVFCSLFKVTGCKGGSGRRRKIKCFCLPSANQDFLCNSENYFHSPLKTFTMELSVSLLPCSILLSLSLLLFYFHFHFYTLR